MPVLIRIRVGEMIPVRRIRGIVSGKEDGFLGAQYSIVEAGIELNLVGSSVPFLFRRSGVGNHKRPGVLICIGILLCTDMWKACAW